MHAARHSTPARSMTQDAIIGSSGGTAHPVSFEHVDFHYGAKQALFDVHLDVPARQVTAFIGPSGCGKSTVLRCLNRMNDLVTGARVTAGRVLLEGSDINLPEVDVTCLRRRVGMVFQKSNPFPRSIYDNVAYGLRIAGERSKAVIAQAVEASLKASALWDEVKDRLHSSAFGLSGGQQQRLCIARAIAVKPDVLLMDEPCSALDPIATAHVEELIQQLSERYTMIIVTHNMEQALRVAHRTAFFLLGRIIEHGPTLEIFQNPQLPETERYVTGKMG